MPEHRIFSMAFAKVYPLYVQKAERKQRTKDKGVLCGVRVEDLDDPLMQKIRWLDKLVDELAKGKALDKILRRA